MKYILLTWGLLLMTTNEVLGSNDYASALLNEAENKRMVRKLISSDQSINVRDLTKAEKEWIYEVKLLHSVRSLKDAGLTNCEELYNALGELASFYNYKGRADLSSKNYEELAELELKNALNGNLDDIGHFNELRQRKVLTDDFFAKLIEEAQEEPKHGTKRKYEKMIEKDDLKAHILSLVNAYQALEKSTVEARKKDNLPLIPLYDKAIKLELEDLQKSLKKRKQSK
ncbi:MAG: hypothetical protein IBJ00_01220 [Alphaproteobacteria bacterium]|nr:hypothetical protein [Alphaproteobacteria bacterium]